MLYICEKFHDNISNGFQLTVQISVHGRNGYIHWSKGNSSKSRQTKVKVHEFCMSSHSALHCLKFLKNISDGLSYGADTNDGSADGQTVRISEGIT